jgi:hypothetical protein
LTGKVDSIVSGAVGRRAGTEDIVTHLLGSFGTLEEVHVDDFDGEDGLVSRDGESTALGSTKCTVRSTATALTSVLDFCLRIEGRIEDEVPADDASTSSDIKG